MKIDTDIVALWHLEPKLFPNSGDIMVSNLGIGYFDEEGHFRPIFKFVLMVRILREVLIPQTSLMNASVSVLGL